MALILSSFFRALLFFLPCLLFLWLARYRKKGFYKKDILSVLFLFYLLFLFFITVYRDGLHPGEGGSLNGIPFRDLAEMLLRGEYGSFLYLFIGNIIWFIPFGFLLPQIKPYSFRRTVLLGFLTSLLIEGLQYLFATGISETDDLILNTLGAVLGCGLCHIVKKERKQ